MSRSEDRREGWATLGQGLVSGTVEGQTQEGYVVNIVILFRVCGGKGKGVRQEGRRER